MQGRERNRGAVILLAAICEGGLALLAWGLGRLMEVPPENQIHLTWSAALWGLAATLPPGLGLLWVRRSRLRPIRRLVHLLERLIVPLFAACTWLDLALISLLAGIGEEALFRGVIQASLVDPLGVWPAILLAGLVFGLAHSITPAYAVLAGLMGIYLGWLAVWQDNLMVPIVTHAVYDFLALSYLLRIHARRRAAAAPRAPDKTPSEATSSDEPEPVDDSNRI